jgi:glucosylceramidase
MFPKFPDFPISRFSALFLILSPLMSSAAPWTLVETARDGGHRLEKLDTPSSAPASASAPLFRLDASVRHQEIVGFGGALTESSAWVIAQLPPERAAEVLRRYYDPREGIGYTLARTHINSCDFSLNLWALDEVPGDYDLHGFTLAPMRKWLMPLLHQARDIAGAGRFRLLASPWSPPAWMKTNNRMDDGGSLRREYAPAWAEYFVQFVKRMESEEKLPIWALTVQNEPEAHQFWESCLYTPEQERDFVRDHLGPALERSGLSGVKLLGWDHNRDRLEARSDAMLDDPATAKYLWGLGLHWYVSDDYAASARVLAKHPDKKILFTEGCVEKASNIGLWQNGERYARNIIGDLSNGVCGYIDWNIVLDQRGGPNHVGNFCDAPVMVDTRTREIRYNASFYYIAHFSKYVLPGARRIASQGAPAALQTIAFQNPDATLVAVVVNPTDSPVEFILAAGESRLACRIPAHAIQSYLGKL